MRQIKCQGSKRLSEQCFRRPFCFYSGLTKTSTALPRLSSKRTIL
ncbi:branched-chain amino acid permease [Neisseria meningitidis]|nr:branched-chain amino acid permease [Neisseria meningitidis]